MIGQYFVHYLLNRGILSHTQMYEVLEYERSVRVKLGVLAMNAGFMTAAQVQEVHNLQRRYDKQFGVLAVESCFLTERQLNLLLESQGQRHHTLIQAVADKGYLSLEQLETYIANYRRENEITDEEWRTGRTADPDRTLRVLLNFSASGEKAETYYSYIALFFRNIVRFLNDNPALIWPQPLELVCPEDWYVTQAIDGDVSFTTGLLMEESVLLEMASRFSGENLTEIDELTLDSVAEFLNVNNGVFSGVLSEAGTEVNLQPQQVSQTIDRGKENGYRIPIGLSFGRIDLLLSR